jgi:adenylosuccinate lyase
MEKLSLNTISPLDNRYYKKVSEISEYFSYASWVYYRLFVEAEYLKHLIEHLNDNDKNTNDKNYSNIYYFTKVEIDKFHTLLDDRVDKFKRYNELLLGDELITIDNNNILTREELIENLKDDYVYRVLELEKETKHDIKAIEYYLVEFIMTLDPKYHKLTNLVHFGLTSQDINSVGFSLQLKYSLKDVIRPILGSLINKLYSLEEKWKNTKMLAYTHGQPAIPTNLGKEIAVFSERLEFWEDKLQNCEIKTKMGGAVGTLSAHYFAFQNIDWYMFFDGFVDKLGLIRWDTTTQITNYDDIVYIFNIIVGINNVLVDMCQDMWLYISKNYFKLSKTEGQVGSSTMPQKVNPIDFENAEGNLKLANSGLDFLISKLPISRLQRDLTDSTVLRSVGVYFAHSILSYKNILAGLDKLQVNHEVIMNDLESHPECMAEAFQTLMRAHCIPNAYDIIRRATQNIKFKDLGHFKLMMMKKLEEENININDEFKKKIEELTYYNY